MVVIREYSKGVRYQFANRTFSVADVENCINNGYFRANNECYEYFHGYSEDGRHILVIALLNSNPLFICSINRKKEGAIE